MIYMLNASHKLLPVLQVLSDIVIQKSYFLILIA